MEIRKTGDLHFEGGGSTRGKGGGGKVRCREGTDSGRFPSVWDAGSSREEVGIDGCRVYTPSALSREEGASVSPALVVVMSVMI